MFITAPMSRGCSSTTELTTTHADKEPMELATDFESGVGRETPISFRIVLQAYSDIMTRLKIGK